MPQFRFCSPDGLSNTFVYVTHEFLMSHCCRGEKKDSESGREEEEGIRSNGPAKENLKTGEKGRRNMSVREKPGEWKRRDEWGEERKNQSRGGCGQVPRPGPGSAVRLTNGN